MTPPPLLLIDGHNLLYRSWYGFPARILSHDKSEDRTGVFGFASLTTLARQDERRVDVMSADKDFLQLLDDPQVRVLNTMLAEHRRYTAGPDVLTRYGVTAAQWPDYRALTGDPSDHIAGVRGIGPKTAARLLTDGRYLDQIPAEDIRSRWADQWDKALLWREMIRLDRKTDLPDELLTATSTGPLPPAALILEMLGLW
ncbi:5'-3' exonuclease H3TH domain-containing protein [Kitasatospora sp. NPDC058218]|uniref:5'-3' exonuclease H3TH domain-containing protein n=1 Tax=Kitasatospora sp. NPDC058218 TaxID=3346385 RepID=UPI0036DF184B